jgi:hypothetical protein
MDLMLAPAVETIRAWHLRLRLTWSITSLHLHEPRHPFSACLLFDLVSVFQNCLAVDMDTRNQIWKPLNSARREIRLFILAPNEDDKAVPRGRLITRSSDEQLYYEAISHAWGRPSFPEVVIIDGIEWVVSTGVFEALQRLRHPTEEKVFWIDALCIDQSDLKERGEQVNESPYCFCSLCRLQSY